MTIDQWVETIIARHSAAMTRSELLKAIRALSARYVERRGVLPERSPLDSAGKRAAFAAYYAPLHFLTVRAILETNPIPGQPASLIDLGCGTGVASAAWALTQKPRVLLEGIDLHPWALSEARWNWNVLELTGRATRGDMVAHLESLQSSRRDVTKLALVCGWSLNELIADKRDRAIELLLNLTARGATALVIEPIARRLVPWWDDFAQRAQSAGAVSHEWRFDVSFPPALADLDDAAGFDREALTARSVIFAGKQDRQ